MITPPKIQMSPVQVSTLSPFLRNRVFILAENNQFSSDSRIEIKTRHVGGQATVTTVAVKALMMQDSTIHKFAARALLGDLERGESWIQRDGRIQRGSFQERDWSRIEGERLGCRWSLVSKWTSFVAVKETIRRPNSEQQPSNTPAELVMPALNAAAPSIEQVEEDDLGLLRPRGERASGAARSVLGRTPGARFVPAAHDELGYSDEDGDSTDASSNPSESGIDGGNHDEPSDDDQGGLGGEAGANFGGAGGESQSSQFPPAPPSRQGHQSGGSSQIESSQYSNSTSGLDLEVLGLDTVTNEISPSLVNPTYNEVAASSPRLYGPLQANSTWFSQNYLTPGRPNSPYLGNRQNSDRPGFDRLFSTQQTPDTVDPQIGNNGNPVILQRLY